MCSPFGSNQVDVYGDGVSLDGRGGWGLVLQRIDEDVFRRSHSDVVSGRFGPLFHFENRSEFSQQDGPIASECASMLTGESRGIQ